MNQMQMFTRTMKRLDPDDDPPELASLLRRCQVIYKPKGLALEYANLATNPYRGCNHGCIYCLDGNTLISNHDLSVTKLRDLQIGDILLGVSELGQGKSNKTKFIPSVVEAIWTTEKQVYEIELENGMSAKCSSDHRWLTDRGWKFTVGSMGGPDQRPYLTTNNSIRILSHPIITPAETDDYKLGYLSGMIRGDGHIGTHGPYHRTYIRKDRDNNPYTRNDTQHVFSLRLMDMEPLERTKNYLVNFGIFVSSFRFTETMSGIRTRSKKKVEQIKQLITWRDTAEYARGFMAGIFDAEGSYSHPVLRISNSDPEILSFCEQSLRKNGFAYIRDIPNETPNTVVHNIRLLNGRENIIRFFQWCNPAIMRKRTLDGKSLKGNSKLIRITDLGYIDTLYDIQTSTGNFIANGMVSHNCYAPSTLRMKRDEYHGNPHPRKDFLHKLVKDCKKFSDANMGGRVLLAFTCDPYQPIDDDTRLTRDTILPLKAWGLNVQVLTKGGKRALRDLDLFTPDDAFATTLTWVDDQRSEIWEPNAATPGDRIETIRVFHAAGIPTWVSLEPVLDPDVALDLIRITHSFVDLFKVGKLNYAGRLPPERRAEVEGIDWYEFGHAAEDLLKSLGKEYYIKNDLRAAMRPSL